MKKIYKKIIRACDYCPDHAGGWTKTHCLACKPAKVIEGNYSNSFPDWCPLEDYIEGGDLWVQK